MVNKQDAAAKAFFENKSQELRALQSKMMAGDYHKAYVDLIKKALTIAEPEHPNYGCELLLIWSEFLLMACKRLNITAGEYYNDARDASYLLLEVVPLNEECTPVYWQVSDNLQELTTLFFRKLDEQVQKHPLLQNPSVYNAMPWAERKKSSERKPKDIYCSLLREAVLALPPVEILDADKVVRKKLMALNIDDKHKAYVMANSPRYRKMATIGEKLVAAEKFLQNDTTTGKPEAETVSAQ